MSFLDDDQVVSYIDTKIRAGAPRDLVLRAIGVSEVEYREALRLAAEGEEPFATWVESIDAAEAHAQVEHIMVLAVSPDWRAREKAALLANPEAFKQDKDFRTYFDWMLNVIEQETLPAQFDIILKRIDAESPGSPKTSPETEQESQVH